MQSDRTQDQLRAGGRSENPGVDAVPLHYRRRGKTWHARGRIRVGTQTIIVPEFSTGARARVDAEAIGSAREAEIRSDILDGSAGRQRRLTIGDCLEAYLSRTGGVRSYDVVRIAELNELIGDRPLTEAVAAWGTWVTARGSKQKPSSVARWRAVLQAALNHGCAAHEVAAIKLPGIKGAAGEVRAIYLPDAPRRRLLAAYNPHAGCPVLLLAYQGMRTQEALQLDWRRVDFTRRTIHLPASETKSSRARTVFMHPRVDALLFGLWSAAGKPEFGRVFWGARHHA
jgi:Phage integrase family